MKPIPSGRVTAKTYETLDTSTQETYGGAPHFNIRAMTGGGIALLAGLANPRERPNFLSAPPVRR